MSDLISENLLEEANREISIDTPIETIAEEVPPSRLQSSFIDFIQAIKAEKIAPLVEKLSQKLSAEWKILDASWTDKYGDRYQQIKQSVQIAKTRYEEEKSKLDEGSPTLIDRRQSEWAINSGTAGVFVARAEERIKQRLLELWETRKTRA
jgi:hypothetical protein